MYTQLLSELAHTPARLVAVSKTKPPEMILELYQQGQRIFGENKPQEMTSKYELLPKDIEWHFIGHLQTNKVKYIAPFVAMIHSIDSLKVLQEVDKQAAKNDRIIDCLLQFKIAAEDTKFGLSLEDGKSLLQDSDFQALKSVRIVGVMGMATFTDDEEQVRKEFRLLKTIFEQLKTDFFAQEPSFKEISMGMSDDYPIALSESSTLIRIGTLLFGNRTYA
jgi:pyridoxal phosphate enzyme (YggS family)